MICMWYFGKDIMVGLCGVVGGEVFEYIKFFVELCEQVIDCMVEEVEVIGVDVVVGVCLMILMVMMMVVEFLVYGIVVQFEDG